MEFTGYNIEEFKKKHIEGAREGRESLIKIWLVCVGGLVITILLILFGITANLDGTVFVVYLLITIVFGVIASGVLIIGTMLIGIELDVKRAKRRLENPPVLSILENGTIMYKEEGITTKIKKIQTCLINRAKNTLDIISVPTYGSTIGLSFCASNFKQIEDILKQLIAMEAAENFSNKTFNTLLDLYSNSPNELYSELKNLPYVIPIHYHLDTDPKNDDIYILSNDIKINYQTLKINEKKYICVYSGVDNIEYNEYFNKRMVYDFDVLVKEFVFSYNSEHSQLFSDTFRIAGIIINPDKEHIVIDLKDGEI